MVSSGEASRYETAIAINEHLDLGLVINRVDSSYFSEEYFAPRPYSEKLINSRLNNLDRNYMREWKVCLHEYLDSHFKNQ
jgi:dTDP-4-dehydrorhamnose reductase